MRIIQIIKYTLRNTVQASYAKYIRFFANVTEQLCMIYLYHEIHTRYVYFQF